MTPDELEAAFARHIEDGRRLAVIRKIYRQHRERPPISAAFIADRAMERANIPQAQPSLILDRVTKESAAA